MPAAIHGYGLPPRNTSITAAVYSFKRSFTWCGIVEFKLNRLVYAYRLTIIITSLSLLKQTHRQRMERNWTQHESNTVCQFQTRWEMSSKLIILFTRPAFFWEVYWGFSNPVLFWKPICLARQWKHLVNWGNQLPPWLNKSACCPASNSSNMSNMSYS